MTRVSEVNHRIDLESSMYFLRRAVELKPDRGEDEKLTVGYAEFCMGAVNGLEGIRLTEQSAPATANDSGVTAIRRRGYDLITLAISLLKRAAQKGQHLPCLYHLRAYMLLLRRGPGDAAEAAESWLLAAKQSRPVSAKMYFNRACALAKVPSYADALTALEIAIDIVESRGIGRDQFDPRIDARDPAVSPELAPFRDRQSAAFSQRSANGRTFDDLTLGS